MLSVFVERDDTFDVDVFVYGLNGNEKDLVVATDLKDVPPDTTPETLRFTFRKPSYKDASDIMGSSVKADADGNMRIDIVKLQDTALRILLSKWNLKDSEDKPLPVTSMNIDKLHPDVARAAATGVLLKVKV